MMNSETRLQNSWFPKFPSGLAFYSRLNIDLKAQVEIHFSAQCFWFLELHFNFKLPIVKDWTRDFNNVVDKSRDFLSKSVFISVQVHNILQGSPKTRKEGGGGKKRDAKRRDKSTVSSNTLNSLLLMTNCWQRRFNGKWSFQFMTGSPESKHQAFRAGILEVPTAEQTAAYLQSLIEHLPSPKYLHCLLKTWTTWKS